MPWEQNAFSLWLSVSSKDVLFFCVPRCLSRKTAPATGAKTASSLSLREGTSLHWIMAKTMDLREIDLKVAYFGTAAKCIWYFHMFEERLHFAEILKWFQLLHAWTKGREFFFPFAVLSLEYQFQEKEKQNRNKKPVIYRETQKLIGILLSCHFQIFSYTYFFKNNQLVCWFNYVYDYKALLWT